MTINWTSLKDSTLFSEITPENMEKLCNCLTAKEKRFDRDSFILRVGDEVRYVYFILSGSVHIIDEDFWGNRSIIETITADTLFGEAYVFSSMPNHLVSVISAEDSVVLEIDPNRLFEVCSNGCSCHAQLVKNTLYIVSKKVVRLTEKMGHIMQRTIREKLLSYLSKYAQREQTNHFKIPYSRQQLADFLCVDRSALSHELSRLQSQGIVRYYKNQFELLREPNKI